MFTDLENKVVVVTGGASGIDAQFAKRLVKLKQK